MKLLFDQNLSAKLCDRLREIFPGSTQTGLLGLEMATDADVWSAARDGGFILVTQDADFSDMAALRGPPPKIVWLRCGNRPTSFVVDLLRRYSETIEDFAVEQESACLEIG